MVQAHSFGLSHLTIDLPFLSRAQTNPSWPLPLASPASSLDNLDSTRPIRRSIVSSISRYSSDDNHSDRTMMSDDNNRAIAASATGRPGDTYDMAYFLKTTGPSSTAERLEALREHRNKRKKLMPQFAPIFRKKKDSFIDYDVHTPRMPNMVDAPTIVQRVSDSGTKYYEIVTPLKPLAGTEDVNDVSLSGELFGPSSQRTSISRATSNLAAVDTEDMHNWFEKFTPVPQTATRSDNDASVLRAKAFAGPITKEESFSAKGPSVISTNGTGDCEFGLTTFERLSTRSMSPIDWTALTARASMMRIDGMDSEAPLTPRKTLTHRSSADTLTDPQIHRSGTKRPRSEELEANLAVNESQDNVETVLMPRRGHHNRELSVLDLDAMVNGRLTAHNVAHNEAESQRHTEGKDRSRRPPPLSLGPALPVGVGSSFDSDAPTVVPELERGLSSSEESLSDLPKTPTPSPKVRRQPKFRLTPTPPRRSVARNSAQINQAAPFHFSLPYPPTSPTRSSLARAPCPPVSSMRTPTHSHSSSVRAANFPTPKLLRNARPAPSFPLPPTPPRTASPLHRNHSLRSTASAAVPATTATTSNSQRSSVASATAVPSRSSRQSSSMAAARLTAQLESVMHEKELLEAALKAVLLTNGRLNRCPCSMGGSNHQHSHSHSNSLSHSHSHSHSHSDGSVQLDNPNTSSHLVDADASTSASTTTAHGINAKHSKRVSSASLADRPTTSSYRHSDSAESMLSTDSSVSALEVYMATRLDRDALLAQH